MIAKTRGQRFYMVRLACGDGVRRPEPMRLFVARVEQATGIVIHASELSEIENDKPSKAVTADHIGAVAAVDPLKRGRDWLGWGEETKAPSIPEGVPVQSYNQEEDAKQAAKDRAAIARRKARKAGGGR